MGAPMRAQAQFRLARVGGEREIERDMESDGENFLAYHAAVLAAAASSTVAECGSSNEGIL